MPHNTADARVAHNFLMGMLANQCSNRNEVRDYLADTQTFLDDFRRGQESRKPRFEVFLVPGATPGDLKGYDPYAWRAIQGHSGFNIPAQETMNWRLIGDDEAPELWHGTARAYMSSIVKTGLIPGAA